MCCMGSAVRALTTEAVLSHVPRKGEGHSLAWWRVLGRPAVGHPQVTPAAVWRVIGDVCGLMPGLDGLRLWLFAKHPAPFQREAQTHPCRPMEVVQRSRDTVTQELCHVLPGWVSAGAKGRTGQSEQTRKAACRGSLGTDGSQGDGIPGRLSVPSKCFVL